MAARHLTTMLPLTNHPPGLHFKPGAPAEPLTNFVADKSILIAEVDDYECYRSMLYALGARSVSNKMMAHVTQIVHGRAAPPAKARAKYPAGEFIPAQGVLPLFHQEIHSFSAFVRALQSHGFTVRNPSDEGDPDFDHFEIPLVEGSLHTTLLRYLGESAFIRDFVTKQVFPIDKRDEAYLDFPIPGSEGLTWYYRWNSAGWDRVHAHRGEDDFPLEIKGPQLLRVAPVLWTASTGLYFHEYPHIDSITGLFIQAGVDARTGLVNGAAISRVWT